MAFRVVTVAAAQAAVSINSSPVRRQASGSSSGAAATGSAAGSSATPVNRITPAPTVVSLWQQSREEAFRVGTAYLPVPSGSIAPGAAATTVVYYYTGQVTVTDLEISTRVATVPVTVGGGSRLRRSVVNPPDDCMCRGRHLFWQPSHRRPLCRILQQL